MHPSVVALVIAGRGGDTPCDREKRNDRHDDGRFENTSEHDSFRFETQVKTKASRASGDKANGATSLENRVGEGGQALYLADTVCALLCLRFLAPKTKRNDLKKTTARPGRLFTIAKKSPRLLSDPHSSCGALLPPPSRSYRGALTKISRKRSSQEMPEPSRGRTHCSF